MIHQALQFVEKEVNTYFDARFGQSTQKWVSIGNPAKLTDEQANAGNNNTSGVVFGIVNVEEDRISKSPDNFRKVNEKIEYRNPKVFLNLYLLFAVNKTDYLQSLKELSLVIQFFQQKFAFDLQNSPGLDPKIERLIMELYSLNFEQLNHLWGVLGGKYLPSVLYKMRVVGIEDETVESIAEPILDININPLLLPQS
jgi:hypothetical protein